MLQFERWLSSEHADELLSLLKDRKVLYMQQLENPEASDAELLATAHSIQGVAMTVNYISAIVNNARQKENERG